MVTQVVDIVNRALQMIGTRSIITATELAAGGSNEAVQANLVLDNTRRTLLRMAPWNMSLKTANLTLITSSPGTPENISAATTLWQPGQPAPPWTYEYQYPVDCLRACWIIPSTQTGFAGGVPITTAVTGGAASFWLGPPVKFRVQNDNFFGVISASVASGGSGYLVGDIITLAGAAAGNPPIGAPAQLQVASIGAGGAVASVTVVNHVFGEATPIGGSYFSVQPNPQAQASTTGSGTGATFNLTYQGPAPQRVILCNQEFATLSYVQDITDPNVMDEQFISAWTALLAAYLAIPLTGDKALANQKVDMANALIVQARSADGNESLWLNDVTPDWIRTRGIYLPEPYGGPYYGFDWGATLVPYF